MRTEQNPRINLPILVAIQLEAAYRMHIGTLVQVRLVVWLRPEQE